MVLGALAALLDMEPDIKVVAQAVDGNEAFELIQHHQPDVLLTDIEMPGLSGLALAQKLKQAAQGVGYKVKIIVLTTFGRPGYIRRALEAGVSGFLLKDTPAERLADAVRKVHRGGRTIDSELAAQAWTENDPLTDRERQVLQLAGQGKTSGEIAEVLHLSQGTIRNYLSEAIGKLQVSNRVEAARLARQKGWL